jgi:hypothetical protein
MRKPKRAPAVDDGLAWHRQRIEELEAELRWHKQIVARAVTENLTRTIHPAGLPRIGRGRLTSRGWRSE